MAERIFRKKSEENGRGDIEVSSASFINMEGAPADSKAVDILEGKGFDGYGHRSRLLTEDMVAGADKIIVMESIQKEMIIDKYPDAEDKIYLLKSFSGDVDRPNDNIKDPYGLSSYHYRLCFAEIYMAIERLCKKCI
ncbi:MAG: hypothetical protein H8E80_08115 [Desulfobacteraceae bacterium]|uniref:protein-tyrosine-phosphatase n=1 Tax=Candidatus Desulfaltia bathyphila TaxID=2841697 RepID=A0A8J6N8Y8_9BACT|nr:hypothetical protein [Candidatus Desulfaltia bathyphila]